MSGAINSTSPASGTRRPIPTARQFGYTDADRLQSGVGPWGTLTYGYDASGNRTAEGLVSGGTTQTDAYAYVTGTNRLDHINRNGTLLRSFTSDAAGNIVAETRSGTAYASLHNQNGRLSEIDVNGTPTATYLYDALERLTVRVTMNMTPAGTTHFISDPAGHILAEADATGATQREYIWLDDLPLAVVANVPTTPTLWYVHADHLGRPIRMSDATKAIVWSAEWLPFGGAQSITGSASLDLRFPGQWFQIEAGLAYNWHRHYDATTGRYIESDPIGPRGGVNLYSYATDKPISNSDPFWLQTPPPPPASIPGGPWTCSPDPGNGRGGAWLGPNGASASW